MKRFLVTGFVFLLCLRMTFSQEILTLETAVRTGLANNYGINIAKNRQTITRNNATPGNAGMLPKIDMSAGAGLGLATAKLESPTGVTIDNSTANSYNSAAGLNLNWTLFDGLQMFITYDKLKKLEEMGDLEAKIAVENTLACILAAYYDIIRQERTTAILKEQVGISEFRLDLARLKFETGSGSELELLKANVELNADVASLSCQETVYMNSLATLNELMARDVTTRFGVRDTILLYYQLNYDSLRTSMKECNRNLLLYNRKTDVHALEMKSARAAQWPVLSLNAGLNYLNSSSEASFTSYNHQLGGAAGLTAYVNLFNGMNLQRKYRNAKISLSSSEMEVKQLENQLDAYLLKLYNEYINQLQLVKFETQNITLAQKNMEIARESYTLGAISSLQLREIQKDLLTANTRLVDAEFRAKFTETALVLLSGKLLK